MVMKINEITDITRATPHNREVFKQKTMAARRVESLPDEITEEEDECSTVNPVSNGGSARSEKTRDVTRRSEK